MLFPNLCICEDCFGLVKSRDDLDRDAHADTCRSCGSTHIEYFTKGHAIALAERIEVLLKPEQTAALRDLDALKTYLETK